MQGQYDSRDLPVEQIVGYYSVRHITHQIVSDPCCGPYGACHDALTRTEFQVRGHAHDHSLYFLDEATTMPQHVINSTLPARTTTTDARGKTTTTLATTGDDLLDEAYERYRKTCTHVCSDRCRIRCSGTGKRAAATCRYGIPFDPGGDEECLERTRMGTWPRSQDECSLVPSSCHMIQMLRAHVNVQGCDSARVALYINRYITKTDTTAILTEEEQLALPAHIRDAKSTPRGMQCLVTELLGYPTFNATSGHIVLDLRPAEQRTFMAKSATQLEREARARRHGRPPDDEDGNGDGGGTDGRAANPELQHARSLARDMTKNRHGLRQATGAAAMDDTLGTAEDTSRAARDAAVRSAKRAHAVADPDVLRTSNMQRYEERFLSIPVPWLVRRRDASDAARTSTLRGPAQLNSGMEAAARTQPAPLIAGYTSLTLDKTEQDGTGIVPGFAASNQPMSLEDERFQRLHGPDMHSFGRCFGLGDSAAQREAAP